MKIDFESWPPNHSNAETHSHPYNGSIFDLRYKYYNIFPGEEFKEIDENDKGIMKLEIIAEDVYFNPWESDFQVDTAKKIKVEVKGQGETKPKTNHSDWGNYHKPRMIVQEVKKPKQSKKSINPVDKVVNVLHKQGVGVSTIYESKKEMIPMLKKYSTKAGYKRGAKNFIKEVIQKLSKK